MDFLVELESAIMEHPHIAEAAVIGIEDAKWGEGPVAYVVPTPLRHRKPVTCTAKQPSMAIEQHAGR